jgi:hypothetical protein
MELDEIVLKKPDRRNDYNFADGLMDLVEKVRVDVAFGQAEVPILYEPIYRRIPGPFPGKVCGHR